MHSFKKSIYKSNKVREKVFTPPTVVASADIELLYEEEIAILDATVTLGDGTIVSTEWTLTSGTGAVITSPNNLTTSVSNLTSELYTFTITVTDSNGLTASDTLVITREAGSTLTLTETQNITDTQALSETNNQRHDIVIAPLLEAGEQLILNTTVGLILNGTLGTITNNAQVNFYRNGNYLYGYNVSNQANYDETFNPTLTINSGDVFEVRLTTYAAIPDGESSTAVASFVVNSANFLNSNKGINNLPSSVLYSQAYVGPSEGT